LIEAIEATFIQLISGIAWGQWLAAGFLLVLGIFLGTMLARSVGRLVESRTSRHHQVLIRRLVFYVIFVLFAIAALREAGFSLEVVLGAAGILTVAIGFASQTSASNIISGLFLVMEVNSSPGLEGIENATGKNVAGMIINWTEKNYKPWKTKTRGRG